MTEQPPVGRYHRPSRGISPLVELIMSDPQMISRLGSQHSDDGRGRCRSCRAGDQTGNYRYPCATRLAVDEARRMLEKADPA